MSSEDELYRCFYSDNFEAARVFDSERGCCHTIDLSKLEPPLTQYAASTTATTKGKRDGDDADSDVKALRRVERKNAKSYAQSEMARSVRQRQVRARVLPTLAEPFYDPKYIATSIEVPWSIAQVAAIEKISWDTPIVVACMNSVKNLVMRDGLKFVRDNVELVPKREFQEYVVRRLHSFAYSCIETIQKLGIVPLVYEMDPNTGQRWPVVPAIGSYILKRHTVGGSVRYRFYWVNEQQFREQWMKQAVRVRDQQGAYNWSYRSVAEPYGVNRLGGNYDPTVKILSDFGHDMTSTGMLTSRVASLVDMAYQRMRLQRARIVAESNAAAPPMVTEHNHQADAQASAQFAGGHFVSSGGPIDDAGNEHEVAMGTFTRDVAQREAYAGLLRAYEQVSGRDASSMFGVRHDEYQTDLGGTAVIQPNATTAEGVQAQWASQYHISSARRLVHTTPAQVSHDFVNVLQHMDDEVCAVFGVPKTYVFGEATRNGNTDLITNRLTDDISQLKNTVSNILTHVYGELFIGDDIGNYLASPVRNRRAAAPDLVNEEDLFVSEALKRVRVTFAKAPSENPAELIQMFALGLIEWPMLRAEMARRNGFDAAQLADDDSEAASMSLEMRRSLIGELQKFQEFDFMRQQHKDQMKMQQQQMRAQENAAAQQTVTQVAAAAVAPAQSSGKSESSEKSAKGSSASKSPELSAISKAASMLAAAGAALKKKRDEERKAAEEGNDKDSEKAISPEKKKKTKE